MRLPRIVTWLCCALAVVSAQVAAAASELSSAVVPAGQATVLKVRVQGIGENMVAFSTMRSTARLQSVALVDPTGRKVWVKTPEQLGLVPRQQVRDPDRGDSIVLPNLRDAAAGMWGIEVVPVADGRTAGTALFAYEVLPRFGLNMHVGAQTAYVGEPVLVTVRPTEYGTPRGGIGPLSVGVSKADGTGFTSQVEAIESAKTPEGVVITAESGTYLAKVQFSEPGTYKFLSRTRAIGRAGESMATAEGSIVVAPRVAQVRLVGLREDAPEGTGCVQRVFIDFDVSGVDGVRYALNASMSGHDGRTIRSNKGFEMTGQSSRQSVTFPAKDLPTSDWPTKLLRVALLKIDASGGIRVVDEQLDFSVRGAGAAARHACR